MDKYIYKIYTTYYFFLFSAALDIIFYPIGAIVVTEVWNWVIKLYAKWLNPELPADEIAQQITTSALSSNLFNIVPFAGDSSRLDFHPYYAQKVLVWYQENEREQLSIKHLHHS